jgi:hypothetical protein
MKAIKIKISVADIRVKQPCYDPTEIKGITDKTSMTLMEWMSVKGYKNGEADKVWLFTEFADELMCRKFAIWCARRCKTTIPEIDACISAIEGYYILGTHTKEQMDAADRAAYWAACRAAYWAAYRPAYWAADRAACRAAYWAAYRPAYWAADRAADWAAYWSADRADERRVQVREIKRMLKEVGE